MKKLLAILLTLAMLVPMLWFCGGKCARRDKDSHFPERLQCEGAGGGHRRSGGESRQ